MHTDERNGDGTARSVNQQVSARLLALVVGARRALTPLVFTAVLTLVCVIAFEYFRSVMMPEVPPRAAHTITALFASAVAGIAAYLALRTQQALISYVARRLDENESHSRELTEYRDRLEVVVAERTAALITSNEKLRREIEEHERAEREVRNHAERTVRYQGVLLNLSKQDFSNTPGAIAAILEASARTLDVGRVGVWFFDDARAHLVCSDLYHASTATHTSGEKIAVASNPAYFRSLEDSRVIAAGDARTDERTRELAAYLGPFGITSLLAVTLRVHGRIAGTLCHEHTGPPRVWTPEEQDFAGSIADLVSLALAFAERARAEEALRESERRLSLAQDFGAVGSWDWNIRTGEGLWSETTYQIFGVRPEDFAGKVSNFYQFVHPDDQPVVRQAMKSCLDSGAEYDIEHRIVRPDGSVRWVAERGNVLRDDNGAPVRMLGIVRDITERRQIEEDLAAEKERLTVTLRSIGDGVITADISGTVVLINKMAENLTGWTQGGACGKPLRRVFRILDEQSRLPVEDILSRTIEEGGGVTIHRESILVAHDGSERLIANSGAPIRDGDNNIIGIVVVFRDITRQRQLEQEVLEVQKLESIGLLAGGIAHDFNNILTAVLGNLSEARLNMPHGAPYADRLGDAEAAALRARDLTQQLLTFSKGGAPVKQTASVADLLTETAKFILSGSNVKCEFSIPPDTWPVECDTGQISQVIQNLLINAEEAMPGGGVIRVAVTNTVVKRTTDAALAPGRYVAIRIADEGIGIPSEHLQRIFDPYFTTKQRGSGLGLAVAFAVVRRHGGHISVESSLSVGTTFLIHLPASDAASARTRPETKRIAAGSGRILIMDDEDAIRDFVARALEKFGYSVDAAAEGREALERYVAARNAGDPYRAVILDLTVPGGMGGKELIRLLHEVDPAVRAIVSSGYSTDPIIAEFISYGFCGFIVKPYRIEELVSAVHDAVSGAQARGPQ